MHCCFRLFYVNTVKAGEMVGPIFFLLCQVGAPLKGHLIHIPCTAPPKLPHCVSIQATQIAIVSYMLGDLWEKVVTCRKKLFAELRNIRRYNNIGPCVQNGVKVSFPV